VTDTAKGGSKIGMVFPERNKRKAETQEVQNQNPNKKLKSDYKPKTNASKTTSGEVLTQKEAANARQLCYACGGEHKGKCILADKPESNKSKTIAYKDSFQCGFTTDEQGKPVTKMPFKGNYHNASTSKGAYKFDYSSEIPKPKQGELLTSLTNKQATNKDTITISVNNRQIEALLDTGALKSDFVNEQTAQLLKEGDDVEEINVRKRKIICALGQSTSVDKKLCFNFDYVNEISKLQETAKACAFVINSPHDMIIGRPTISREELHLKLPSQFKAHDPDTETAAVGVEAQPTSVAAVEDNVSEKPSLISLLQTPANPNELKPATRAGISSPKDRNPASMQDSVRYKKEDFIHLDIKAPTDIVDKELPAVNDQRKFEKPSEEFIFGSPGLKAEINKLLEEYICLFSKELAKEPADLEPFEIHVIKELWEKPFNQRSATRQSPAKQLALEKSIQDHLAMNVIRPSKAQYWSQLIMEQKPHRDPPEYRTCFDGRAINAASRPEVSHIPNMKHMIQRIGAHKPKLFVKMDMTSGYFQCATAENSRSYTAFNTHRGIFEWNRVPMGCRGAPTHFQRQMAQRVLAGLVGVYCECYIDDILIYACTEAELLERMRAVFERFKKYRVTLHPTKCYFGLNEVEFVGHTIDESGVSFSKKKLQEVYDFPKPYRQHQLKSLLGLANVFRDSVRNHSITAASLNKLITPYRKHDIIVWTEQASADYDKLKEDVMNIPKMFFINDHDEIVVYTDASDYGVGGAVFQGGVPIAFVSKSLTTQQTDWSTPDKEAFALHFTLQKCDYLLRDAHFLLKTDHKNLTYINTDNSHKVRRWKMAIAEYDFDLEFVEGHNNPVGDGLSRIPLSEERHLVQALAALTEDNREEQEVLCAILDGFKIPTEVYKLISKNCHNSQVGHFGVDITYQKLCQVEKNIVSLCGDKPVKACVQAFIRQCPCCQKLSQIKTPILTQRFTTVASRPFERVNVDVIDGFLESPEGFKHILVIIDTFSRWVMLYALLTNTAREWADKINNFMGIFGPPLQLLSDSGPQFKAELNAELLLLSSTQEVKAIAYSKEENSLVERANKEVNRHIQASCFDEKTKFNWPRFLPNISRLINTRTNKATGVAPASLILGANANLIPILADARVAAQAVTKGVKLSDYAAEMLKGQNALLRIAASNQTKKDNEHMAGTPAIVTHFEPDSFVLVQYQEALGGKRLAPSKNHTRWRGPYRVISNVGANYTLIDLTTMKSKDNYNIRDLKPFSFDPEIYDPVELALRDTDLKLVEQIKKAWNISGKNQPIDREKEKKLHFQVKWVDDVFPIGDSENDLRNFEKYANLKHNPLLHDWIRLNRPDRIPDLIPQQYKTEDELTLKSLKFKK